MDLEPVLQFVINRLMRSDSADLTILDKLISIMSGVTQVENDAISDDQLQAYAAGREMVKEAFNSTLISIARPADLSDVTAKPKEAPIDKGKSTKRSLPRLVNAMRFTELAMPIWIALGQTRQGAVDKMASAPIKAMSAMQDTVSLNHRVRRHRHFTHSLLSGSRHFDPIWRTLDRIPHHRGAHVLDA